MLDFLDYDGFLGSRASLMMDIVVLAMFAVLPVLFWSVYQVKYRRRFVVHKRVQIALGTILLLAVSLFELHLILHDWRQRAMTPAESEVSTAVFLLINVHLSCAIPTAVLWVFVIYRALRLMPSPPKPCAYSYLHRKWGRLAVFGMCMTALTGWVFYVFAFFV